VPLGRGLSAGLKLYDLHVDEVATPGEMGEGAARLESRPRGKIELQKVEPEAFVDRDALAGDPFLVRVDEESRL
jgi:hypothetical protein